MNVERPTLNKRVRLEPQTENLISNGRGLNNQNSFTPSTLSILSENNQNLPILDQSPQQLDTRASTSESRESITEPINNPRNQVPLSSSEQYGPNYEPFKNILSKYFSSAKVLKTVINLFLNLQEDGHISFNQIMRTIGPGSRPNGDQRLALMQELRESGLVTITKKSKIIYKIERGPNFIRYMHK